MNVRKIKEKWWLYILWILTAIYPLFFIGYVFSLDGSERSWWYGLTGLGASIVALICVVLLDKLSLKLFFGLLGIEIFYRIMLNFNGPSIGMGDIGYAFINYFILILFVPLFLLEHFFYKKASVIILAIIFILEIVVPFYIAFGAKYGF